MNENGIARVHYFPQQFLRKQEFEAEQAYHLTMRRRHNIAHHSWGIVCGLEVTVEENIPFVMPGMAIDGYGREIILAKKVPLAVSTFDEKDTDVLDVLITYDRVGSDDVPKGYANCQNDNETSYYRWQERPIIYMEKPDPAHLFRREPESVPEGDLQFMPYHALTDDPTNDWPVFLGQVRQEGEAPDFEYKPVAKERPFVGLRGEQINSPSGNAHVQIGAERIDDDRRFVISTKNILNKNLVRRLQINQKGELDIYQKTAVHGDIHVTNGSVEFGIGQINGDPANPWRMYRYRTPEGSEGSETLVQNELRIEMKKGEPTGNNSVVIGYWSAEKETFMPCMTISDDCSVKIHGNLFVQGVIKAKKVPSTVSFDPDAKNLAKAAMLSGVSGASTLLERFYRSPYSSDLEIVASLLDDEAGREAVAGVVLDNPERAKNFLAIILNDASGRKTTLDVLAIEQTRLDAFVREIIDFNTIDNEGIKALVTSLEVDERREKVIGAFIVNDDINATFVNKLFGSDGGQESFVTYLADAVAIPDEELTEFVTKLRGEDRIRDATLENFYTHDVTLIEMVEGLSRAAILNRLNTHPDNPMAPFVDAMFADAFAAPLFAEEDLGTRAITRLLTLLANTMPVGSLDPGDELIGFANLIKSVDPDMAAKLAAALLLP